MFTFVYEVRKVNSDLEWVAWRGLRGIWAPGVNKCDWAFDLKSYNKSNLEITTRQRGLQAFAAKLACKKVFYLN